MKVAIDKPWRNNALINGDGLMLVANLVFDMLLRAGGDDAAISNTGLNLSGVYGCLCHLLFLCLPHAVDDLAGSGQAFL